MLKVKKTETTKIVKTYYLKLMFEENDKVPLRIKCDEIVDDLIYKFYLASQLHKDEDRWIPSHTVKADHFDSAVEMYVDYLKALQERVIKETEKRKQEE